MKKSNYFMLLTFLLLLVGWTSCSGDETKKEEYEKPYVPGQPVVVSNIGPLEGGLGTRVVVSGENFGNDTSKVKLFFNSKEALILKLQSNAIYAMVPKQPGDLSTIKVLIEDGKDAEGKPTYKEALLTDKQFKYNIKATVTTVAGKVGVKEMKDGMALEGSFQRAVMLSVDNTGTILVTDDGGDAIRMVSVTDNKLSTVLTGLSNPWQSAFSSDFNRFFVLEREASARPLLFKALAKSSNWQESENYYDQKDDKDNYIAGSSVYYGLAADQEYVYLLATSGKRLVRVNQTSRKVELIGENLNMESWSHITYNPKNGYLYISCDGWGRIYRLNPRLTPAGHTTPWITQTDVEHIVGTGKGAAREGNGRSAQLGSVEGLAADADGNVYVTDYLNHVIWKIDEEFNATIFAGVPGTKGYKDGKPKEALFSNPWGVTSTPDGILYVADTDNSVIRCIAIQ